MKKIFVLSFFVYSTSVLAALPTFSPQNLEAYKATQRDNMSRLRVNLTVSSHDEVAVINISNFSLCSATTCWKAKVNKSVPVVNSSTTRGLLIADVLIPNKEKIEAVFFEPTTAKQSIEGYLKFEKVVNFDPEYQGQNLYIVLDKTSQENGESRYFPVASSALPFNPELKYYLIDPKFTQSIHLNSKSKITFPSKFLPKPQLFVISEHNVGKKFPMLDIYPYMKGKGNLKIQLAEINKRINNSSATRATTSVNYSEITSPSTLLIVGSDTPSRVSTFSPIKSSPP